MYKAWSSASLLRRISSFLSSRAYAATLAAYKEWILLTIASAVSVEKYLRILA
jgi:hypothetical protein